MVTERERGARFHEAEREPRFAIEQVVVEAVLGRERGRGERIERLAAQAELRAGVCEDTVRVCDSARRSHAAARRRLELADDHVLGVQ